jgi:hypothetical protein
MNLSHKFGKCALLSDNARAHNHNPARDIEASKIALRQQPAQPPLTVKKTLWCENFSATRDNFVLSSVRGTEYLRSFPFGVTAEPGKARTSGKSCREDLMPCFGSGNAAAAVSRGAGARHD